MSKRTTYTEISPLPPNISRETVLNFLHDHLGMIDLNPLVKERHPIPAPPDAPPEEKHCTWYSLTDTISYLPGGFATGEISYTAVFNDIPNGLLTHCRAPLGVDIRSRWTLNGSLPGEPPERAEIGIGAPATGLYIREDVDLRCNILLAGFIKRTTKKAHQSLVDNLAAKAQAAADMDAATLAATATSTSIALHGPNAGRLSSYGPAPPSSTQGPPSLPPSYGSQAPGVLGQHTGRPAHGYSASDGNVRLISPATEELSVPFSSTSAFQPFMTPATPRPQRFMAMPPPPPAPYTTPLPSQQQFSPRQPAYPETVQQGSPPLPAFLLPPRPPTATQPSSGGIQRHSLDSSKQRVYVAYNPPNFTTGVPSTPSWPCPPSPSVNSSVGSEEDYLGDGDCVSPSTLYPNPLRVRRSLGGGGGGGLTHSPSILQVLGTPVLPMSVKYPEMNPYTDEINDEDDVFSIAPAPHGGYGDLNGMHPMPLRPGSRRPPRLTIDNDIVPAALRPGSGPIQSSSSNINFGVFVP